jgi:hypothetical protein
LVSCRAVASCEGWLAKEGIDWLGYSSADEGKSKQKEAR